MDKASTFFLCARRSTSSLGVSKKVVAILGVLAAVAAGGAIFGGRAPAPLPPDARVDSLVVQKSQRTLLAYSKGSLLRTYRVSLGRDPVGPKQRQGDRRTPEGRYFIDAHNPNSSYHRALHVSYQSPGDTARAHAAGYDPGGEIMVHGIRNGLGWIGRAHLLVDWTVGCVAMTDPEIDELYRIVPDGTPIDLRP